MDKEDLAMRKRLLTLGFAFGFAFGFVLSVLVLTSLQLDMTITGSEYRQCNRTAYTLIGVTPAPWLAFGLGF